MDILQGLCFCAVLGLFTSCEGSILTYGSGKDTDNDIQAIVRMYGEIMKPHLEYRQLTVTSFSWSNCGTQGDLAKVSSITLGPDPLPVPGNVTIGFSASVSKDISAPIELNLEIQKKVLLWVTIPCVDNVGSCDYEDICTLLSIITCPPAFKKHNIPCQCPVAAGKYSLPTTTIEVNPFGIPSWLEGGSYKVKATTKHQNQQILCLNMEFSLK